MYDMTNGFVFLRQKWKIWDLRDDGNMFKTLKGHSLEVFWCCWSPNARLLASAGGGKSVLIWNMENYTLARTLAGHQHNVGCCEFSPDGAVLASASWDTRVILWDPYTGTCLTLSSLHKGRSLFSFFFSFSFFFFFFFFFVVVVVVGQSLFSHSFRWNTTDTLPSVPYSETHFCVGCQRFVGTWCSLRP